MAYSREQYQRIKLGLEEKTTKAKPKKALKKVSDKKRKEDAEAKEARGGEDTELQKWYKARQKQLCGKCLRCGTKYNHTNLKYAICATAHVLAKRPEMFPSVGLHPENFIELGAQCGCHNWYDNMASWEQIAISNIWPVVLEKFRLIEPHIKERSLIPEVFLQEIKPKI
jgi:hypothetical protein